MIIDNVVKSLFFTPLNYNLEIGMAIITFPIVKRYKVSRGIIPIFQTWYQRLPASHD